MSQVVVNLGKGGTVLNGRLGSTTSADSNDPVFLPHVGDNGGNYIYFGGNNNNFMSIPYEAALQITGDIDIRAYVAPATWSVNQGLVSRFDNNTVADRAYELNIITGNRLQFLYRTAASTANVTRVSVAHTVPNGAAKWVRFTLDVDNGNSQNVAKFFLSDDGETWTQLGTDIINAGVTDINDGGTTEPLVLGRRSTGGSIFMTGKYYRAQVFNGIDGTKVVDIDTSVITTGNQTTLTALTGQTVTLATSAVVGPRMVRVVSPVWLFAVDDYIEVADNSLIDFNAADSFTIVAINRQWSNYAEDATIAKKSDTTTSTQGYLLGGNVATTQALGSRVRSQMGDGTNGVSVVSTTGRTSGEITVSALVRNVAADTVTTYRNTEATSATDTTTGSIANSEVFRIGRLSGAGTLYGNFELVSALVFRKALTATEISKIISYYQARLT